VVPRELASDLVATAVTLEPRGGSPQPTGQLFLKGAL
jgi:anti-sigma-K factor RskA